jgi:hypothetical protein
MYAAASCSGIQVQAHLCHDDDEADVVDVGVDRVVPRHRNADLELARQVLSARISVLGFNLLVCEALSMKHEADWCMRP